MIRPFQSATSLSSPISSRLALREVEPTKRSMVPRISSGLLFLMNCIERHIALVKAWTFSGSFSIVAVRQKLTFTGTGPPMMAFQGPASEGE